MLLALVIACCVAVIGESRGDNVSFGCARVNVVRDLHAPDADLVLEDSPPGTAPCHLTVGPNVTVRKLFFGSPSHQAFMSNATVRSIVVHNVSARSIVFGPVLGYHDGGGIHVSNVFVRSSETDCFAAVMCYYPANWTPPLLVSWQCNPRADRAERAPRFFTIRDSVFHHFGERHCTEDCRVMRLIGIGADLIEVTNCTLEGGRRSITAQHVVANQFLIRSNRIVVHHSRNWGDRNPLMFLNMLIEDAFVLDGNTIDAISQQTGPVLVSIGNMHSARAGAAVHVKENRLSVQHNGSGTASAVIDIFRVSNMSLVAVVANTVRYGRVCGYGIELRLLRDVRTVQISRNRIDVDAELEIASPFVVAVGIAFAPDVESGDWSTPALWNVERCLVTQNSVIVRHRGVGVNDQGVSVAIAALLFSMTNVPELRFEDNDITVFADWERFLAVPAGKIAAGFASMLMPLAIFINVTTVTVSRNTIRLNVSGATHAGLLGLESWSRNSARAGCAERGARPSIGAPPRVSCPHRGTRARAPVSR